MYRYIRSKDLISLASRASLRSGILSVTFTDMSGDVPHVTNGSRDAASILMDLSKVASASVVSDLQASTERSHSSPFGANGLPLMYSKVVSSGAMRPALAPPSMLILQTVIRPSID